jgi:putative DNA methylase
MTQPKKLIEVAMPVKEVSAESVRDKSIRHGHISTLHLWWARRPLPVCRAVVFASLVPDPLDENCPAPFKQAVAKYLADKKYKPYDDIPHTAAIDPMEDNLRNRLLMFIGRFSDEYVKNEKEGKKTASKKQLSEGSLIKWENKNNPKIIGIARKLIFIAHNTSENSAEGFSPLGEMSEERGQRGHMRADLISLEAKYNSLWTAITTAEKDLYTTPNRHLETAEIKGKEKALHDAIENYLDHMPRVFDPFAGGGAIPLEAARLGCRTYGNDINPVAHIIQRGSVEFPQKYGKPITYSREAF